MRGESSRELIARPSIPLLLDYSIIRLIVYRLLPNPPNFFPIQY